MTIIIIITIIYNNDNNNNDYNVGHTPGFGCKEHIGHRWKYLQGPFFSRNFIFQQTLLFIKLDLCFKQLIFFYKTLCFFQKTQLFQNFFVFMKSCFVIQKTQHCDLKKSYFYKKKTSFSLNSIYLKTKLPPTLYSYFSRWPILDLVGMWW